MKNARIQPLILITCIFAAFVVGLFMGRNSERAPVQIQPIPSVSAAVETAATEMSATEPAPTELSTVNINTATSEQLQTLPSIGPVLAGRIIAYRTEHDGFRSVGELTNVPGIGEKTLEAIWDLVTLGG